MGQNKLSGYQKLKREILELKQKLIIVASAPDSEEGKRIITEIKLSKDIENAIWAGHTDNHKFEGLLKQIAQ